MLNQKKILIVGGGISGITAALELAETGHCVTLIEKKTYLGGNVAKFSYYFPKLCPPHCGLELNFQRIRNNHNIRILTSTVLDTYKKTDKSFEVKLNSKHEFINNNCTSCGKCAEVCPVERSDDFNYGLTKTKAAFLPYPLVFPYKYSIDDSVCKQENCGLCLDVCPYNAISFENKSTLLTEEFDSIILSTGWQAYDAGKIENLNYAFHPDIVTNVEFERLLSPEGPTNGQIVKLSDKKVPESIVFVQCAGSRDINHLPYCSAVCCSATLKHAIIASEKIKNVKITILYIDLRVSGRNEDLLQKAKEINHISFIKGKAGKVNIDLQNNLDIEYEDILKGKKCKIPADMVILATGIVPSTVSGFKTDNELFIDEELLPQGIFATGSVKKPIDVSASVKDAGRMALKSIQSMANE